MYEEIKASFARAHFVDEWANEQERLGWPDGSSSGCDLMDLAPETPKEYLEYADKWLCEFVSANSHLKASADRDHIVGELDTIYGDFQDDADFNRDEGQPVRQELMNFDRFGHYLYMEARGHGVGLWEWADHDLKLPDPEYLEVFPEDLSDE